MGNKTVRYVVFRHGCNAFNQHMCERMAVGVFEGTGPTAKVRREGACAEALAAGVVCYINQYLTAKPAWHVKGSES